MIGTKQPFPNTLSHIRTADLLRAYEEGADQIRAGIRDLDEDEITARPRGDGTWSVRQIVIHLADSELMGAARIRQALADPEPTFAGYDQNRWESAFAYNSADAPQMDETLVLFHALRVTTGRLLRSCTEDDWGRAGFHPEWGRITVRQLLELYADHGERHLEQIRAIRDDLGRPVDVPSLLEDRLY